MAASSISDDHECWSEKRRYMCIYPAKRSSLIPFTDRTWPRYLQFVLSWQNLEGDQAEIARNFVKNHADEFDEFGEHGNSTVTILAIAIPQDAAFHQVCYSRFTDKQRVSRVQSSMKKREENAANTGRLNNLNNKS